MDNLAEIFIATPSSSTLSDDELSRECNNLLQAYLFKTPAANLAGGTDLLGLLDPGLNTLSYAFILCSKVDVNGPSAFDSCWHYAARLLQTYDPRQIKFAQREFRRVVEAFANYAMDNGKPIAAVRPLQKAILRSTDPSQFSFIHPLFLQVCLRAKCFRDALPVLDIDIFDFPMSRTTADEPLPGSRLQEVTYQDVLSYFLFGGIIYIGVKNWRRSMDMLTYVVAAPGSRCSNIQVEAYKKFVLVGLLMNGKIQALPRSTPMPTNRTYKALSKPYEAFARAFVSGDVNVFSQEIALTAEVFNQDGNAGLADQCVKAFRKQQIIALKDTYVTLGVDEIAQKNFDVSKKAAGGSRGTEQLILGMIERGEIQASLSHSSPDPHTNRTTVQFDSGTQAGCDPKALEEQIRRTVALTQQVKQMDRKLGMSRDYIKYQLRELKGTNPSSMPIQDSDLMDFDYGGEGWEEGDHDVLHDLDDD